MAIEGGFFQACMPTSPNSILPESTKSCKSSRAVSTCKTCNSPCSIDLLCGSDSGWGSRRPPAIPNPLIRLTTCSRVEVNRFLQAAFDQSVPGSRRGQDGQDLFAEKTNFYEFSIRYHAGILRIRLASTPRSGNELAYDGSPSRQGITCPSPCGESRIFGSRKALRAAHSLTPQ